MTPAGRFACALAAVALAAGLTGGVSLAKQRSAQDKALFERAQKDCNGPHYANGARIQMNYAAGTYKCIEIQTGKR